MYELGTVSFAAIGGMIFSLVISVLLPIALLIIAKVKYNAKVSSFFIGAGIFILFALVLEQILHLVVISVLGGQEKLTGNILLYALYGGMAAAVFEETGRFVAFKKLMKNRLDRTNAFMYGIGHGGIEAIIIMGLGSVSNILAAAMINNGVFKASLEILDDATKAVTYEQISQLWTLPAYQFYMGGVERITAIALHIALTFIMYRGVKFNEKKNIFIAFLIHFVVDASTVIMGQYMPIYVVEIVLEVMCAGVIYYAYVINISEYEELEQYQGEETEELVQYQGEE